MGTSRPASPGLAPPALVALLTLMTLELVRSSGPLLDRAYGLAGVPAAAATALATYAAPGLFAGLVLLAVRRHPGGTLLVSTGLLAVLRLVVQALDGGARFAVGLVTVAVGVAALTLAVAVLAGRPDGGRLAAAAVSVGAAAAVGLQLTLGTWDAYWRHTLVGWLVTIAVVGTGAGLAVLTWSRSAVVPEGTQARRLWALGPFLALVAMMLANPAFAASQSGVPLALAGPLHAVGLLLAAWRLTRIGGPARGWHLGITAALLVLAIAGGVYLASSLVLAALLVAQVSAVLALGSALAPSSAASGLLLSRTAGAAAVVGLGTIAPILAYQSDYDLPLPFPNELVLLATAVVLGLSGLRRARGMPDTTAGQLPRGLVAAGTALVLLGTAVAVTTWALTSRVAGDAPLSTGRVLSWNLHYGVSSAGSVDLEAVAHTIETHDPDVVLLQEVSRGWVQGGGADTATWLAARLGRQFSFAPAADGRFGNVILSRQPPRAVRIQPLPYGNGPQQRSALSADVELGQRTVRATSIHLQNRRANTPTRIRQLETFLAGLEGDGPAEAPRVVGSDLNAEPGSPEVALLSRAGFVSAVDAAGDPEALTSPVPSPTRRIDWVFSRGLTVEEATVLTDARSSDHLPIVVVTG